MTTEDPAKGRHKNNSVIASEAKQSGTRRLLLRFAGNDEEENEEVIYDRALSVPAREWR